MRITAQLCWFKRKKDSPKENGLMLDEDQMIIDEAGCLVKPPVHDYHCDSTKGYAVFEGNPAGEAK